MADQKKRRMLNAASIPAYGCTTCRRSFQKKGLLALDRGYGTLKGKNDYQIRCMDAAAAV